MTEEEAFEYDRLYAECERLRAAQITPEIARYQDDLIARETDIENLQKELGRAYRALHAFHAAHSKGERLSNATVAYHTPTVAAAARFVHCGALDGADYFINKNISVLHDAMKPQ